LDFSVRGAVQRHFSRQMYTVFIVQAYGISHYMVPHGGTFLLQVVQLFRRKF
jgi:hypothetical protein